MVVVNIIGGLGNQLRAYAFGYTVANYLNQQLVLDISTYKAGYFRPFALDYLNIPCHVKLVYPQKNFYYFSIAGAPDAFNSMFDRVVNTGRIQDRKQLLDHVSGGGNVYIEGYGGIGLCTPEEILQLKTLFQLRSPSDFQQKFKGHVNNRDSVSVHVRRTDFLNNHWVCEETLKYYKASITLCRNTMENPLFFIFSDDILWCKNHLGRSHDLFYMNLLGGIESDLEELYCMSACRHHILTNHSTFGWWASWLSENGVGINLLNGLDGMSGLENIVLLSPEQIEQLALDYHLDGIEGVYDYEIDAGFCEKMLAENHNDEALLYIDSHNYYINTDEIKTACLEMKGIAHFQKGDYHQALSCFREVPFSDRDEDYFFNYTLALMGAGRRIEGIVHAANLLFTYNNGNLIDYIGEMSEDEQTVFHLVSSMGRRHYFFFDLYGSKTAHGYSINGYYEGIAIFLRSLGNHVTILQGISEGCFWDVENTEENIDKAIEEMMHTNIEYGTINDFGMEKYNLIWLTQPSLRCLVPQLIKRLTNDGQAVLVTHFHEGLWGDYSYPLIFLDTISENDNFKQIADQYGDEDWHSIWAESSKVITYQNPLHGYGHKKTEPFAGTQNTENKFRFITGRVMDTEPYMCNEETIWGALSILKAVWEISES